MDTPVRRTITRWHIEQFCEGHWYKMGLHTNRRNADDELEVFLRRKPGEQFRIVEVETVTTETRKFVGPTRIGSFFR